MSRRGPHNSNITWLPHLRVAWGGILGTTNEVWTNSMKFLPATNTPITKTQAGPLMDVIKTVLSTWFTAAGATSRSDIGKDAKLTWVKVNSINGDGLQFSGDTNILEFAPVLGGGGESSFVPFYQSFAVSWMTAVKRGRTHMGRIYPPCSISPIIAGTGLQDPLAAAAQATAAAQLLTSLNTEVAARYTNGKFAVFSPGNALKNTLPLSATINGCTVDTVPDTQHRRTNRLAGVRSSSFVVT